MVNKSSRKVLGLAAILPIPGDDDARKYAGQQTEEHVADHGGGSGMFMRGPSGTTFPNVGIDPTHSGQFRRPY